MSSGGRQYFSNLEKMCLQELIMKYKLNSTGGNISAKKEAWARIVEEYNSIESNSKRTETQLKKCWDNLKSRKKAQLVQEQEDLLANEKKDLLAEEKKDYMIPSERTFKGHLKAESSEEDPLSNDETSSDQNNVEFPYVIYSENLREDSNPAATNNDRTKFVTDGTNLKIRKLNNKRLWEREEELHNLTIAEKKWLVKTAEELYHKAKVERHTAEIKREEAELDLYIKKRNIQKI